MNKKNMFLIGTLVIILGCYIGLLTLVAPILGPAFGVTLLFSLIPMILLAVIIMLFMPENSIKGYFFQETSIRLAILYIVIQFIAGFILTILMVKLRLVFIVEFIILGVFGSVTAYAAYAGLHASDVEKHHKEVISNMKKNQAEAKSIMDSVVDYEWKRLVKSVWEEINYAPPATKEGTEQIEEDIFFELGMLRAAVDEKNREHFDASASRIKELLAARK